MQQSCPSQIATVQSCSVEGLPTESARLFPRLEQIEWWGNHTMGGLPGFWRGHWSPLHRHPWADWAAGWAPQNFSLSKADNSGLSAGSPDHSCSPPGSSWSPGKEFVIVSPKSLNKNLLEEGLLSHWYGVDSRGTSVADTQPIHLFQSLKTLRVHRT